MVTTTAHRAQAKRRRESGLCKGWGNFTRLKLGFRGAPPAGPRRGCFGIGMKTSGLLVFAAVMSALTGLVHWFVWNRLVRDAAWPSPWGRFLGFLLLALGLLIPAAILALRFAPRWLSGPASWIGFSCMGFVF